MKKVTYQDISKKTGISLATISRIIKGNPAVNKELVIRVNDAIKELGYEIPEKKQLPQGPSRLIIMEVPSVVNRFYTDIIRGVTEKASCCNYSILLHESASTSPVDELIDIVKRTNAAGIISALNLENEKRITSLVPIVQCCEKSSKGSVPYVSIDDIQATIRATELLLSHGNNRIAFINGPLSYRYAIDRLKGFEIALERANKKIIPQLVTSLSDISYDIAYSAAHTLFSKDKKPDAVFAASDIVAVAAANVAKSYGLRIPEDIEIIGFDDIDIARMTSPALTTIRQPCYQMGLNCCEMLIELIEQGESKARCLLLPTELIIRESTR